MKGSVEMRRKNGACVVLIQTGTGYKVFSAKSTINVDSDSNEKRKNGLKIMG